MILSEIANYKILYNEMLSERAFELYREYLKGDSDSSKSNIYSLLCTLLCKYHSHMKDEKNSSNSYGFYDYDEEENTVS